MPLEGALEFAAGVTFDYAHAPLTATVVSANGANATTTLVRNALLARLGASFTPVHWMWFDVALPIALVETGTSATAAPGGHAEVAGQGPGVGDLRLGLHFRPLDTKAFGLVLGGRVWAPLGAQSTYLSDGTLRGELDLGGAGENDKARYGCTFSLAPGFFARRDGDRVAGSCAIYLRATKAFAVGFEPSFEVVSQSRVAVAAGSGGEVFAALFEPLVGMRLDVDSVRIGLAAGPGFGSATGAADGRALLSFAYIGAGRPPAPPVISGPPDRDLDGTPDDVDACPDEAGPPSTNGCPVRDADGDGVPDEEDACPSMPGVRHPNPKANGCPDTDNDGFPDPVDKCPREPGQKPAGCPKFTHLGPGGFTIEPVIDFGAGERLRPDARVALGELAATLRANPRLPRVRITLGTKGVRGPVNEKRTHEILGVLAAANLEAGRFELVLKEAVRAGLVEVKSEP